jgi:uracil-DNA glycosylase family 4
MTRWSERQRAMLEAMGLHLWVPPPAAVAASAAVPTAGSPPMRMAAPAAPAALPAPALRHAPARLAPALPAPLPMAAAESVPTAQTADAASMDWATLERTVEHCVACPLAKRRTRTVFGAGHPEAHWMIVGEAPGEQEDLSGEPFVGASGRLLDRMLAALGLTRGAAPPERQVYIANTVKCRPPGNRNPEPAELAACEAFLARQIALVQPRVIVALGRVAAHWLLRTDEPLGRLRGRVHRYRGVSLVVTYHPAYLLRQPGDKARAWDDLCLAREAVGAAAAAAAGDAAAAPASAGQAA